MVVPLKLTGFSVFSKAEEVMNFLKKAKLKDFELFLSLEKSGEKKNAFTGTTYILVKSEFDVASVMRLRGQRVGRNYIDISRCSLRELKDANLYPSPSPILFEEVGGLSPIRKTGKSHLSKSSHFSNDYLRDTDESVRRKNPSSTFVEENIHHDSSIRNDYIHRSPEENFVGYISRPSLTDDTKRKKNYDDSSLILNNKYEKVAISAPNAGINSVTTYDRKISSKSSVPYDCYIKIFYIGQEVSKQDVFNFFETVSFPVDIIYSFFETGPHTTKMRGEAFVLFSSPKEALKSMKMNSEKLGLSRVALVFPTKEEIDTVIYQNEQKLKKNVEIQPNVNLNTNNKGSSLDKDDLAYSLLNVVTNILAKNTSHSLKKDTTMVEDLDLRRKDIENSRPQFINEKPHLTYIKISNVSPQVTSEEIVNFFKDFKCAISTLKRNPPLPGKRSTEWELGFEEYQEALSAIRKLNYQLLKYQPIELAVI